MSDFVMLNKKENRELQKIQIEILKKIIDICDNLNLKYYVIGGTALGTIRHGGFIPWDDDIDIGMPRKDYEIFLAKGPKMLTNNYFIQTYISDPLYPNNYAKIRDSNTTFIEKPVKHINMNHGVYIDIFPLDGASKSIIRKVIFKAKQKIYSKKISELFDGPRYNKKNNLKRIISKIICDILLSKYSHKDIIVKRENLYKRYDYNDSKIVTNYSGAYGDKEIVPKSYFGEGQKKIFEGIEVVVPEKYDKYLTNIYGDYMKLPPNEERVTRHYCFTIDINKSYKNYL